MADEKSAIRASKELINYLKVRANFGESLEEVIWRLIKNDGREGTKIKKNLQEVQ